MTNQYFSQNPDVESDRRTWTFSLRGNSLTFTTDNGVFSKNEVDFGSRLLIDTFNLPAVDGDILDLGCGYGPVGIALAKDFPDRNIIGVDINQRALELATENAWQNNVKNVSFLKSDIFSEIKEKKFAAILTNPPIRAGKQVVYQMLEDSRQALLTGGELSVVIQKKQGAPSAQKKLEELFSEVEVVVKKKGYFIFRAK
ncbi:class I SAM-dependent methyltransferase [Gracilibacillus dipsosauri]|uniref:class I SAM-dependent methyltransferase n=1 Tax=Gracilibacillus dipsosauri TaxID=178340 RepID=UPI00240A7FAD